MNDLLQSPLSRALLLSLCLHLAVLALVRVRSSVGHELAQVIQVRLVDSGAAQTEASEQARERPAEPAQATPPAKNSRPTAGPGGAAHATEASGLAFDLPLMVDLRWYGPREVDGHPRALDRIQPVYPEDARRQGQVGWVKVRLKIDEQGRVSDTEIVEAQPPGVFDAATVEAFRQARFEPARRQGLPVRYEGLFRVVFELE